MFRLTRETRLAVNRSASDHRQPSRHNGHAGYPSLLDAGGHFFALQTTLFGDLHPDSSYLVNIKDIDAAVIERALPTLEYAVYYDSIKPQQQPLIARLFDRLCGHWPPGVHLESLSLSLSPFLTLSAIASELPMTRLSQKFEFSAAHRLHNPALSDEQNHQTYGKCNNPFGHGHNYELQVTLVGTADSTGVLVHVPDFERIVHDHVIEKFDHKHLNAQLPEFATLIPSVETIAAVIYRLLKVPLTTPRTKLAAVTVWETPKTWCEYSEANDE